MIAVNTILFNKKDMTKIYLLTYKDGQKRVYLSKAALYEDNTPEELGVSMHTIDRIDFSFDTYENSKVTIEMFCARTKNEIIAEKEKFL